MKFNDIIQVKTCQHAFRADKGLLPYHLQKRFVKVNQIHSYPTRNSNNLYADIGKSNLKQMCLSVKGVQLFNPLPDEIKYARNVKTFNKKIKKMLLKSY